jgi:hypothetical protein
MQQKTELLATKVKTDIKKPSKILEKLTDKCVSEFGKLNVAVNKALERGRLEGFEDRQVGDMIRRKMIAAGYSRMTVSRALPPSAKHMEKARSISSSTSSSKSGNKMLPKSSASAAQAMLPDKAGDKDKNKIKFGNKMLPDMLTNTNTNTNTKEFGNKMLPNLEGITMKPNLQILGFNGRISKMGSDRRVICVPTHLYTSLSKFEDKQIRVEISLV